MGKFEKLTLRELKDISGGRKMNRSHFRKIIGGIFSSLSISK
ncbi:hypothetical protein [Liquorilactobacillus aquaticus]|nr:hypothetical protein [Liquorilactobacillus aquaticus]